MAGAERSFSCLKRLKIYLRNTMGQERLNNLVILTIERGFQPKINSVINQFAAKKTSSITVIDKHKYLI